MIFKDTIEIITASATQNKYGDWEYDWANPTILHTVSARVDYRSTAMLADDNRFMSKAELIAYCQPVTMNPATQRVRWSGLQYEPDGQVLEYRKGRSTFYVEIPLKTVQPQP